MPPIDVTISTEGINRAIDQLKGRLKRSNDACFVIATELRNSILKRTRSGKDSEGTEFRPYSSRYGAFREEHHRATSPVTLTYRNNMLASMTVRKVENGAVIGFNSELERRKARRHNEGLAGMPRRHFFDISQAERTSAAKRFASLLRGGK